MNVQLGDPGEKWLATALAKLGFDESERGYIAAAEAGTCESTLRDLRRRGLDSFPLDRAMHLYGFINGFCLGLMLGGDEQGAASGERHRRDVQLAWNHVQAVKASAGPGEHWPTDVSMYDAVHHGEPWLAAILAEHGSKSGVAAAEAGTAKSTWHDLRGRERHSPPLTRAMHLYGFISGLRWGLGLDQYPGG